MAKKTKQVSAVGLQRRIKELQAALRQEQENVRNKAVDALKCRDNWEKFEAQLAEEKAAHQTTKERLAEAERGRFQYCQQREQSLMCVIAGLNDQVKQLHEQAAEQSGHIALLRGIIIEGLRSHPRPKS